jgi:hypothetical protein
VVGPSNVDLRLSDAPEHSERSIVSECVGLSDLPFIGAGERMYEFKYEVEYVVDDELEYEAEYDYVAESDYLVEFMVDYEVGAKLLRNILNPFILIVVLILIEQYLKLSWNFVRLLIEFFGRYLHRLKRIISLSD